MRFIIDVLICLVSVVVSLIIFNIILNALNQSIFNPFVKIQKLVDKLKRRELVRIIIIAISIGLCVEIKDLYNLNYIGFGILIGFFNALYDVIFKTGFASKKNGNE